MENWLESDLMLGGLAAQKSTSNLFILLKTLWKLDATALAAQNMITQVKTLKIISALGKKHQWYGNLWSRIDNALQNPNPDLSVITALYRDFLNYFHITPWRALTI